MNETTEIQDAKLDQWSVDDHVPALLTWISYKVAAVGTRLYQDRFDLGISDWRVLSYLGIFGEGTNQSIHSFIGVDKAVVSRSVARLKDRGLISVTPTDGRSAELALTAEGRVTGNQMLKIAERIDQELMHGLTPEDRAAFVATIKKMLENLPRMRQLT